MGNFVGAMVPLVLPIVDTLISAFTEKPKCLTPSTTKFAAKQSNDDVEQLKRELRGVQAREVAFRDMANEKIQALEQKLHEQTSSSSSDGRLRALEQKVKEQTATSRADVPSLLALKAKKKLGMDIVNRFNMGICGETGAGKSTLINAVRGIKDRAKGAAPTGVTETTEISRRYDTGLNLDLWDLPGACTPSHPLEPYFKDEMLYAFDIVFVAFEEQFEALGRIVEECAENRVNCALIRTKADLIPSDEVESVRRNLREVSQTFGVRGFLLSSLEFTRYSYDEKALLDYVYIVAKVRLQPDGAEVSW